MGDIKEQLRAKLVERLKGETLAQIAQESGINRACLNLFRNRQRDLSKENIDKLRIHFGLILRLEPVEQFVSGLRGDFRPGRLRVITSTSLPPSSSSASSRLGKERTDD